MSIVFIMPDRDCSEVAAHVRRLASIPVHEHGQEMCQLEREAVRLAVLWHPPPNSAADYPGLEAVMSYGAGVEFIMSDDTLPQTLLRGRLVDEHLKIQMARYLLAVVLSAETRLDRYRLNQAEQQWQSDESAVATTIGILGHGQLSRFTGRLFQQLGYRVNYWRRTEGDVSNGIFSGPDGLKTVAAAADVLICLLPLTSQTRGVLGAELFPSLQNRRSSDQCRAWWPPRCG